MSSPSHFRVLFREALFSIADLEILSARADIAQLLGQLAAMLAALSLMFCQGAIRLMRSQSAASETLVRAWTDEHFLIATTMAVVGVFAVLSWDTALPNRRDILILAPLPVRIRTVFLAKLAATASVLGLAGLAANAFTGLSYPLALGLVRGGWFDVIRSFAAYWAVMLASGAFMFLGMLALQGLLAQLLPRQLYLQAATVLQFVAFAAILAVYFLMPPLATLSALGEPTTAALAAQLPSYWFLGLFQQLNGSSHPLTATLAARAWTGLGVAAVAAGFALLTSYLRITRKLIEEPDVEPARLRMRRFIPSSPLFAAIRDFCVRTMLRSRQHRLVLACYLGIGFAISSAYARTLLYGFYSRAPQPWDEVNRPILVITLVMTSFAIIGVRTAFALPVHLAANWIFQTAASRPPSEYLQATRRDLYLFGTPMLALCIVGLLLIWPPWPTLGHAVLLALAAVILVNLSLRGFRKIPFTCSYLPGKAKLHVTAGALTLVLTALADVVIAREVGALDHPIQYVIGLIAVAVVAFWTHRQTSQAMFSPDRSLQFEEEPPADVLTLNLDTVSAMPREDC